MLGRAGSHRPTDQGRRWPQQTVRQGRTGAMRQRRTMMLSARTPPVGPALRCPRESSARPIGSPAFRRETSVNGMSRHSAGATPVDNDASRQSGDGSPMRGRQLRIGLAGAPARSSERMRPYRRAQRGRFSPCQGFEPFLVAAGGRTAVGSTRLTGIQACGRWASVDRHRGPAASPLSSGAIRRPAARRRSPVKAAGVGPFPSP